MTLTQYDARGLESDQELRAAYLRLVEQRFGLHLSEHQSRHLPEAVARALADGGYSAARELYDVLAGGVRRDLLENIAAALTVGETHFFRVQPQIDALRWTVLPEVIRRRSGERRLRLWSAGCSSGEEPYTLAMLVSQQLSARHDWDVLLLATDISPRALATAREALYGEWSFRETPDDARKRYFTREGRQWRLVESIRRMVRFSYFNLLDDAFPPTPLGEGQVDMILCRNVTIYFTAEVATRLYGRFASALSDGGWLILGPSDPVPSGVSGLEPVNAPGAVLWRRVAGTGRDRSGDGVKERKKSLGLPASRISGAANGEAGGIIGGNGSGGAAVGTTIPLSSARVPVNATSYPQRREAPALRSHDLASGGLEQVWHLAHSGAIEEARLCAEKVAAAQPLMAEAHLLLGLLCLESGSSDRALESLRRAAFLQPNLAFAHFTMGRVYLQVGIKERAETELTQVGKLLAGVTDHQPVDGGGGMLAGELRYAAEALLAGLTRDGNR